MRSLLCKLMLGRSGKALLLFLLCLSLCPLTLATYRCDNGQRTAGDEVLRPHFHFYPSTIESQDISAPIKIGNAWHVFMDCVPEGCPALVQPVQDKPLSWCHFSSTDLVHWAEHPIAIAPDRPFDGSIIDTGAISQHPNGTIFALYATSNITSNLATGTFDGDLCIATAEDPMLLVWNKKCDMPSARITNPTCHWCRQTCPQDCADSVRSSAPSAFPGIAARMAHRDPTAPWLDRCAENSTDLCWYSLSGSGGKINGSFQNAALLWRTDHLISTKWEFVRVFQTSPGRAGGVYSCPDFFRLPQSDVFAFGVLGGSLWLGNLSFDDKGPRFDEFNEQAPSTSSVWSPNCSDPNGAPCFGFDRPGDDLKVFETNYTGGEQGCEQLCDEEPLCMAWTFCDLGAADPQHTPRCCLKRDVPSAVIAQEHMVCSFPKRARGHVPPSALRPPAKPTPPALKTSFSAMGIWKTGGEGANNVQNASSRRLLFGTVGWTGGNAIPAEDSTVRSLHVGSVAALPRDLSLRSGEKQLQVDFVPELSGLRITESHVHIPNAFAGASIGFSSRYAEVQAIFDACENTKGQAFGLTILAPKNVKGTLPSAGYAGVNIGYDPFHNMLEVTGTSRGSTSLELAANEGLQLHVFVDGNLIEVVANRRASIAAVVTIPAASATNASEVGVFGASCNGTVLDAWALKSIWT